MASKSLLWGSNESIPSYEVEPPPSMNSAICSMAVFDKFGWEQELLGLSGADAFINELSGISNADTDSFTLNSKNSISEFGSLRSIFPDLLDDKNHPMVDPISSYLACDSEFDTKLDIIKEEPFTTDDVKETLLSSTLSLPLLNDIKMEKLDDVIIPSVTDNLYNTTATITTTATSTLITPNVISTSITSTASNYLPSTPSTGSLIRIPVRRSLNSSVDPNFSKPGTSRPVKAVVVCPSRTKSIVCNVVRSTSKGIIIQKPTTVSRSLLNAAVAVATSSSSSSSSAVVKTAETTTKLPIMAVNVISSKEFRSRMDAAAAAVSTIDEVKVEPTLAAIHCEENIKIEYEEVRPETPVSMNSDEEFLFSSTSPSANGVGKPLDFFHETFLKSSCLLDDDNFNSDSYKCMPPSVVTGQIQPTIPEVFKYTPNSSPATATDVCLSDDSVDSFFSKITSDSSSLSAGSLNKCSNNFKSQVNHQFFNKAAINVDHDYGFTCRTPKPSSIFSADSLGIQTPSASEPPTDSDDDEMNVDFSLLSKDFDPKEMDRKQHEYFEKLKYQMKLTESLLDVRHESKTLKSKGSIGVSPAKDRKLTSRNRRRKASMKERCHVQPANIGAGSATLINRPATSITAGGLPTTGTLKMRLPTKTASTSTTVQPPKRRKNGSGGRIFSPSERHLHNTNEQVRRIEMRQSFEELRLLVPSLHDKPKAPKVSILQEAKMFCDELYHADQRLQTQLTALRCQQDRLKSTVSQLRKYAAAVRH